MGNIVDLWAGRLRWKDGSWQRCSCRERTATSFWQEQPGNSARRYIKPAKRNVALRLMEVHCLHYKQNNLRSKKHLTLLQVWQETIVECFMNKMYNDDINSDNGGAVHGQRRIGYTAHTGDRFAGLMPLLRLQHCSVSQVQTLNFNWP